MESRKGSCGCGLCFLVSEELGDILLICQDALFSVVTDGWCCNANAFILLLNHNLVLFQELLYVQNENRRCEHLLQRSINALFSRRHRCAQRLRIAAHSVGFQYLDFSPQPATHNKISSSAYLRSEFRPTVEMLSVQTATLLLVLPQLCELHASLCWGFSWHVIFFWLELRSMRERNCYCFKIIYYVEPIFTNPYNFNLCSSVFLLQLQDIMEWAFQQCQRVVGNWKFGVRRYETISSHLFAWVFFLLKRRFLIWAKLLSQ